MDDLISRKKAIEMLCAMRCSCKPEECGLTLEQDGAEECADVRWIMSLPSAQSEQSIKIQDILEYLDTVLHPIISPDHWNVYSELHDMVSMLSSAQPERWIPVSERLPEQYTHVLVYFNRNSHNPVLTCFKVNKCNGMGVAEYYHDGDTKVWRGSGFIPTHWMPLPEPPKEGE